MPRPISGVQKPSPNGSHQHPPPKSVDHQHSQTRSQDEAVCPDHLEQLTVFAWCGDFHLTFTLPLMWSASPSFASQKFAYASLRGSQHPGYFSLRIAICWQTDNSLQYLPWQILWHNPLKKFKEISIVFMETPCCIKTSKWWWLGRLHFKWLPLNWFFPSLESQWSLDNTDCVWTFNLVT